MSIQPWNAHRVSSLLMTLFSPTAFLSSGSWLVKPLISRFSSAHLDVSRFKRRLHRSLSVLRRDPKRWLLLPLALPIIFPALLLYVIARICGLLRRPPKPENLSEIWGDILT